MSQFPRSRFIPSRRKTSSRDFSFLRNALAIGLAALLFSAPLNFNVSARPISGSKISSSYSSLNQNLSVEDSNTKPQEGRVHGFIVEMGANGEASCRSATAEELPFVMAPRDASRERVKFIPERTLDVFQDHATKQGDNIGSGGLTINFNLLSQLQTDPNKAQVVAAFEKAAQYWTSRIKSPVTVDIDIDYGLKTQGGSNFPARVLGSTGTASVPVSYPSLRNNLIAASGSNATRAALYQSLPASSLPSDTGYGGFVDVSASVAKALGVPVGTGSIAAISFNKGFPFDFNPDDGIDFNQTDFVAVATHELGHALGFVSDGGEGDLALPTTWDLFRFRPGTAAGNFTNAQRIMSIGGGEQIFFTGQTYTVAGAATTELGLSTGGPDPPTPDPVGDGSQSSHWKADELTGRFIGIMDPTIHSGVKQVPTENDYSTLEAIGWDLTGNAVIPAAPPPPAPPPNDNFASAQALNGCSGSVIGTNIAATKEANEPNNPASPNSRKSVWYQWQAPSSGSVTIDTAGSGFDTIIGVYTGSSVGGLSIIGSNDDDPNAPSHVTSSSVTFDATQNTIYRIEVNGFNNNGSLGDIGIFKLNWAEAGCSQQTPTPTVQLSQNTNTVSEDAGRVVITVTRTDSTSAATVGYATSDPAGLTNCNVINGIASSRCDYATSVGTLRFAAGETSKTISIPIVDDNFSEGNESFTLTLSNPSGAALGTISSSTVTITDNPSSTGNPIDNVAFFVRQNYIDFLGREPDSFGQGWRDMLNNCASGDITCDRIEVSSRFFRSAEFQERGYFVYRFYSASFGRKPNYEEFIPDVAKVSGFLTEAEKEANKVAFVDEFMARTEFKNRYDSQTTPTAYVDALIASSGLASHPSHDGWIAGLTNGTLTRARVLRELAESQPLSDKYSVEAFVVMQYFGYLRRNPDSQYKVWIATLNQNPADYRRMVDGFMNSTEYRNRFAP
jgi:hypothetical protein